MERPGKRFLKGLGLVAVLGGLLALMALPLRPQPIQAHTPPEGIINGIEVLERGSRITAHALVTAAANGDARGAIAPNTGSAPPRWTVQKGLSVRVSAHVIISGANALDGRAIQVATDFGIITRVSRDENANGALDNAGALTSVFSSSTFGHTVADSSILVADIDAGTGGAQTVGILANGLVDVNGDGAITGADALAIADIDGVTAGAQAATIVAGVFTVGPATIADVDAGTAGAQAATLVAGALRTTAPLICIAASTCIDGMADGPSGIVIVEVQSATAGRGRVSFTDLLTGVAGTVDIAWTDPEAIKLTATSRETVLALAGPDGSEADSDAIRAGGDYDTRIIVKVSDVTSGEDMVGFPTQGAIWCKISPSPRADIVAGDTDDFESPYTGAFGGGNDIFTAVTNDDGESFATVRSDGGGTVGDITLTCGWDENGSRSFEPDETNVVSIKIRVSGPAAKLELTAPTSVPLGGPIGIVAKVADKDGKTVADGTRCTFSATQLVGTAAMNLITPGTQVLTDGGAVGLTAFAGTTDGVATVGVTCDDGAAAVADPSASATVTVGAGAAPPPPPAATVSLSAGMNFVAYTGATKDLPAGLPAAVTSVFHWDAARQAWSWFFPGAPAGVNTLTQLQTGQIYVISTSAAATWTQ